MIAFVLLFALAFAEGTEASCDATKYIKQDSTDNTKCICMTGFTAISGKETETGSELECECVSPKVIAKVTDANGEHLECQDKKACDTTTQEWVQETNTCKCTNGYVTNPDTTKVEETPCVAEATCLAENNIVQTEDKTKCKCVGELKMTEGEEGNPTKCGCPEGQVIIEESNVKKCVAEASCDAAKYIKQTADKSQCECMEGFTKKSGKETETGSELECECVGNNEITGEGAESKCVAKATEASCDASKYIKQTADKSQCECMEGFTKKSGKEAETGSELECECVGNNEITGEGAESKCVAKATEATCDPSLYVKQTADKTACECMDTFTEVAGSNPFACKCDDSKEIKEENGVKKCVEKTKEAESSDGVNGIFLILALAIFFLF